MIIFALKDKLAIEYSGFIMQDLDVDTFEIENWETYCRKCIDAGERWRFQRALSEYLTITMRPFRKEVREYCLRRQGEWAKEEILAKRRKNER